MNHSSESLPEGEASDDKLRRHVEAFFDAIENGDYKSSTFLLEASALDHIAAQLERASADITPATKDDEHHDFD